MRTQTYYENLKTVLRGQLRDVLDAEVQLGWRIMDDETLAVLWHHKDGCLKLDINLRGAECLGSEVSLCNRVIPRMVGVQSAMAQMPDSYLQGLAWLEDLYSIKKHGAITMSALPSGERFRPGKRSVFTAADLYGATCAGELTVLDQIPEICYCGRKTAESSLLRSLEQVRWLQENDFLLPMVTFASHEGGLCSLASLMRRCEEHDDPFWSGVLFRLMAVSNCPISAQSSQMVQLLQQQNDRWRLAAVELWNTAQRNKHPVVQDTMEAVQNILMKLDKKSWSGPADYSVGSLHFL